jgi:UDP-N-acetylmuramoylalanine--D-glutamate ligase
MRPEIELASRFIGCPIVAVAGTNGKSTVTELLGHVFRDAGVGAFVGGNIGTPAVEYLASVGKKGEEGEEKDVCVLEVSSFQLETIREFRPRVAILLNVTEDHLDRYSDFDEYAETKFRLFSNQDRSDWAVVNADDPVISKRLKKGLGGGGKPRVVPFSITKTLEEGLYLKVDEIIYAPGPGAAREAYPTSGLKIKGLHNIENVMAAVAAARLSGLSHGVILRALSTFPGLSHRMEFVSVVDGVEYIDDSKGTNVGALKMALKSMTTPVVLIAGGKDKGGDYGVLEALVREKVKRLILIGEAAGRIRDSLGGLTETTMAATLEEAVRAAYKAASPGDTVLLSPACSSFDMFGSYKERGERFKRLVEAL